MTTHIYCLHAHRLLDTGEAHYFMELFTSEAKLHAYLAAHRDIVDDEITGHDVDPS